MAIAITLFFIQGQKGEEAHIVPRSFLRLNMNRTGYQALHQLMKNAILIVCARWL